MRGTGNLVVYHSHGLWLGIYLDTVGQNAGRFQYNCSMYYRYIFGRNDSQTYLALIQIKVTSELVARLARVKSIVYAVLIRYYIYLGSRYGVISVPGTCSNFSNFFCKNYDETG